jgi:hypothetical protein
MSKNGMVVIFLLGMCCCHYSIFLGIAFVIAIFLAMIIF